MWLRRFQADRVRNLRSVTVEFAAGLNLVTGRNGHGKTSLLEAVYLLGTGYSFRTRRHDELVSRAGGPLHVSGEVSSRTGTETLTVVVDGDRRLRASGQDVDLGAFLGRLDLVALPSDSARVLRDGPDGRRRFLDAGIVGCAPTFLGILGEYRRVLGERNALLRNARARPAEHEVWEERLGEAAERVHRERRAYAVLLATRIQPTGRSLFRDVGDLKLHYLPSPAGATDRSPDTYGTLLRDALARTRERDRTLGFTGVGPHRDDFRVELDGVDLRRYGSGGQVRSAVIALSAGKLGLLKDRRGESPLFLMDDFDSDLDETRTAALLAHLREERFQAILATARESATRDLPGPVKRIRMVEGEARVP